MNLLILNIKHRKMDFSKNLPSEVIQKEFEANPLKILETIRIEKEKQLFDKEEQKSEKEKEESIKNKNEETKNIYAYRDKNENELEDLKIDDFSASFEFKTNETENKTEENQIKNKNIINNINTINNINCHNTLINYNPNLNLNNSNNIIVNHLNIFFNFNSNNNNGNSNNDNLFQSKNDNLDCNNNKNINNNCNNNKQFCNNNINNNDKNNNSNFHQNINNIKNNNLFINHINKLLNNLKSYKGSIICQSYIDNITDKNELSLFFQKILPHLCQIMCQDYGNYFFQKLIKKLNIQQRLNIYQIIEPEFLVIATNKFGTHSIQSLMDTIETPFEHYALNKLISKNMLLLFTDDNAYHIMMKMILDFPEEKRNNLNIYLVMNIEKIIINCNGAFCANKFIINNKNLDLRKLLIENLHNNIKKFIFNKFSCIILLLVLQTFGIEWGGFIIKEIQNNFFFMSEHPTSNIFITKVLEYLNNNNLLVLKLLIWSFYKNIALINYLIANQSQKNLLNQIIGYSDNEQKKYLYFLLKKSNW